MSNKTGNSSASNAKARPLHRITFARIIGKDENGNDVLGPAREIGAIWPRRNGKKGGVLKFDHVPAELSQHKGVIFTLPVDQTRSQTDGQQSMV